MKIYIIWESSGSWEDSYRGIYKVYLDESKAQIECNRLNKKLKDNIEKYETISETIHEHWEICNSDECEICDEYNRVENDYHEQHPYRVECRWVEE